MATDKTTDPTPIDGAPIDPGDSRGAGAPDWPAIGDTKVIDGHTFRWGGRMWQRLDVAR